MGMGVSNNNPQPFIDVVKASETNPDNPFSADVIQKLVDKGMSEEDMYVAKRCVEKLLRDPSITSQEVLQGIDSWLKHSLVPIP